MSDIVEGFEPSNKIKLLPCPFCGGENVIETYMGFLPVLQCADCHSTMTFPASFRGNYKIELAKKWNTRMSIERIIERLEEEATEYKDNFGELIDCIPEHIAIEIVKKEGGIE